MTKSERLYTLQFRRENPERGLQDCFRDAKRTIHFRASLSAMVKENKRRAKAAKKGWASRRRNAA